MSNDANIGKLDAKLVVDSTGFDAGMEKADAQLRKVGESATQTGVKVRKMGEATDRAASMQARALDRARHAWQRELVQQDRAAEKQRELARAQQMAALRADILARSEQTAARATRALGEGTGGVRQQIGLLDNTMRGQHAMAMADLIRGAAESRIVMMALPLAATAAGVVLLSGVVADAAEKFYEWKNRAIEAERALRDFDTGMQNITNSIQDKLIQAQMEADKLAKNHLGAVRLQLELIDHQSMNELVQALKSVGSEADKALAKLKTAWYLPGIGSAGASNAWTDFQSRYQSLMAVGDQKGAANLLSGTLEQWKRVLAMQEKLQKLPQYLTQPGVGLELNPAYLRLSARLSKYGVGAHGNEVESQQRIVAAIEELQHAQDLYGQINTIKKRNARRQGSPSGASAAWSPGSGLLEDARNYQAYNQRLDETLTATFMQQLDARVKRTQAADLAQMTAGLPNAYAGAQYEDLLHIGKRWERYNQNLDRAAEMSARLQAVTGKARLRLEAATGSISRLDEAMGDAALDAASYRAEMSALRRQLARVSRDQSLSFVERKTEALATQTQMAELRARYSQVFDQDLAAEYAARNAASANSMARVFGQGFAGVNSAIVTEMTTPGNMLRGRHVWGQMGAQFFRSATGAALRRAEGDVLKAFGVGKDKLMTRGNPGHVIVDNWGHPGSASDAVGKIGRMVSGGGSMASRVVSAVAGFLPRFAQGGPIPSGMPSIVGENGPELFLPHGAGTIIPNDRAFGTHVTVAPHIDARGAQDPAQVEAAVNRAMERHAPRLVAASVAAVQDYHRRRPNMHR